MSSRSDRWGPAKREDYPEATWSSAKPHFLFKNSPGQTYNASDGDVVWFKTKESAQRKADKLNAEEANAER